MSSNLPYTPYEVLDISTRSLRLKMQAVVTLAKLFGFWKSPDKKMATDFEEMTLGDIFYWAYKSTDPVARMEKGSKDSDRLMKDASIVRLPQGFQKQTSITMGAAGDLLHAEGLELSKDVLFENVSDLLFDQTISYANFESPVTNQPLVKEVIGDRAAPIECSSREQFDVLTSHKGKRFNVLNFSNNHTFDMGVEGMETTLKVFEELGILDSGTNRTPEEAGKGRVLVKDGIKIGFVSATFGLNGQPVPASEKYRINVAKLLSKFADPDLDLLKRQIDHCKSEGCDFIIASMHWGYEFEFFPRLKQIRAARALVEYGADTIISHHPHVIQPLEYYRTKRDPDRVAVITYSMGSVTWGYTAPHIVLSFILNMTMTKGQHNGKTLTYIEQTDITPVFRSAIDSHGKTLTRIERLADHIDGRSDRHPREYIAQIKRYADMVLGQLDYSRSKQTKDSSITKQAA